MLHFSCFFPRRKQHFLLREDGFIHLLHEGTQTMGVNPKPQISLLNYKKLHQTNQHLRFPSLG